MSFLTLRAKLRSPTMASLIRLRLKPRSSFKIMTKKKRKIWSLKRALPRGLSSPSASMKFCISWYAAVNSPIRANNLVPSILFASINFIIEFKMGPRRRNSQGKFIRDDYETEEEARGGFREEANFWSGFLWYAYRLIPVFIFIFILWKVF